LQSSLVQRLAFSRTGCFRETRRAGGVVDGASQVASPGT
jgi:hypothetical protein